MVTNEMLAKVIKEYRTKRAWTQEQLAGAANLSPRTIQRIEVGDQPAPESLMAIADAFGIEVTALTEVTRVNYPNGRANAESDNEEVGELAMLKRIRNGQELLNIAFENQIHQYNCDVLDSKKQVKLAGKFFDELNFAPRKFDFVSLLRNRVFRSIFNYGVYFTEKINRLEKNGILVFGGVIPLSHFGNAEEFEPEPEKIRKINFPYFYLVRKDNSKILANPNGPDFFPLVGMFNSFLPAVKLPPLSILGKEQLSLDEYLQMQAPIRKAEKIGLGILVAVAIGLNVICEVPILKEFFFHRSH